MKIQVLGIACPECDQLCRNVQDALFGLGMEADVEMVADPGRVKSLGVYVTPALALDGRVVIAGRIPSVPEIERLISEKLKP